ncbi:MAG: hypothetical protein KatS3mg082_2500 [Nitrospiraceae bacterium]|nr:MAG: hypothetical protein KatS3mg082_2500 [Nitrospiraceae bacterium]
MLFAPAYLAYAYYEVFSEIGFVYASNTMLGMVFLEYATWRSRLWRW